MPLRAPLSTGVLALLLAVVMIAPAAASNRAAATPAIATLDWPLAETLLALGVNPAGVAQIDAYREWVGEPAIPAEVADLGLRAQPNLELLASLEPDRILISPLFAALEPRLSRIAPVTTVSLYAAPGDTWHNLREATRRVAAIAGREQAGEQLINATEAALREKRRRLPEHTPPLLLVQFMDARHVRVFGEGGLYQAVLDRLGLDNAWHEPTNAWGFSLVGLERLLDFDDARILVIEPLPTGVAETLDSSGLWRHLRDTRQTPVLYLPPAWSFGALASARRFAELLTNALTADTGASLPAPGSTPDA
ncbi:ABC transporter substrate-binding protein [Kushneria aurantia]|uniref:ABC transporter substrate-binding protein n=1 Tax=Kushneria aurantia TaxID=504092 RepID=A0ABV6G1D3_9GAMM|nr:ABC transporter substrate-binding protein [Kushneria aurantia]